ncbi:MAG: nucleotidyl transferase AbiEii/AbiGii toxin family protein [Myxococcota bacterium]
MSVNIPSLKAKLLNMAKEKNVELQVLLDRFGAEQFLARLSQSPVSQQFIFKGGSLLVYLVETSRKTRDIDFSIKQLSNRTDDLLKVIHAILDIPLDDGVTWGRAEAEVLSHPDLEEPGARIICPFQLGQVRGKVQMDLALGDVVDPVKMTLPRMHYKGMPLMGQDFSILTYPPESIFAEKLHIASAKKETNSRMKDYYDLLKLSQSLESPQKLKAAIEATFQNRKTAVPKGIFFDAAQIEVLQIRWAHFLIREKLTDAPRDIAEVIESLNDFLKKLPS